MTDTFITQRKLTIFSFFGALIMMFTTFSTPFFQLGSIVNAQEVPDSYAAEEPELPTAPAPAEPETLLDNTPPLSNLRILDVESNEVATLESPQFIIEYSAEDPTIEGYETTGVAQMRVSENSSFVGAEWTNYTGEIVVENKKFINGEVSKTFYFQSKDSAGNESDIVEKTVSLKQFDIVPNIETDANNMLIGDQGIVQVNLKNSGSDIAYNAFVQLDLPKGFSYLTPTLSSNVEGENIIPSEINTDSEGNQYLVYQSIADLLPGEELDFEIMLQLPSISDGYEIGQIVEIPVSVELFAFTDFAIGYKTESNIDIELKPVRVNLESNTGNEALVGESYENKITIETNPDTPSIKENTYEVDDLTDTISNAIEPLVVLFKLDNVQNYKEGSQRIFINGEEVSLEEYNILFEAASDIYNSNPILKWVFKDQIDTDTIIEIFFGVEIDKYDSDSLIPDYVEHGDNLESTLEVNSGFENNAGDLVEFTNNEIQNIKAKYFTVEKFIERPHPNPLLEGEGADFYSPGDIVTYTVEVETSKSYNLSGVTIEDILPDGVKANEELIIKNEKLILNDNLVDESLVQNYIDSITTNDNGETIIKWNIVEIPASAKYSFQYDVTLTEKYEFKELNNIDLVSSADNLGSSATITGIWSDTNDSVVRSGSDDEDSTRTNFSLERVTHTNKLRLSDSSEYSGSLDVRIGDIVEIRSEVLFPSSTPTNDYHSKIYLPIGTQLIGSPTVEYDGSFESIPENIQVLSTIGVPENPNYIQLDLGDVQKGSKYELSYQLLVTDDPNLKLATQVRNLFRSTYLNIDSEKIIDRSEVTLIIVEPSIEVTKEVTGGYIAAGEEFSVETIIKNSGTSTAYRMDVDDHSLTNAMLVSSPSQIVVSNLGNSFDATYNESIGVLSLNDANLAPGEFITLVYTFKADDSLMFNNRIDSEVIISEHNSRAEDDPKPARMFESEEYNYSWWTRESLLATSIQAYGLNSNTLDQTMFGKYQIGRDHEFNIDFNTEVVGHTPVYESTILYEFSTSPLGDLSGNGKTLSQIGYSISLNGNELTVVDNKVSINDFEANLSYNSETGDLIISNIAKLYPGDVITISYVLKTPKYIAFDLIYGGEVFAFGKNALGQNIRKDGSYQTHYDYDEDDHSAASFITAKIDNDAPTGDISFIINDEYVYATNQDSVDAIEYRAFDNSQVVGVRFSVDGINWNVLNEGEQALARLQTEVVDLLDIVGEWNSWGTNPLLDTRGSQLLAEGKNYRYMQLVDLYGNIATIENYIIKDTVAPSIADVVISPFEGDLSDPIFTGTSENYIHFFSVDDNHLSDGSETDEYSGVGWYRYAAESDQLDEAEWYYMSSGVNMFEFDWGTVQDLDTLNIYLQIKDLAGNLYEGTSTSVKDCSTIEILNPSELDKQVQDAGHTICDDIIFTTDIPEISINLNDGDLYTNNAIVNLGLEITESTSGVQNIKFNDEDWIPYSDSISEYVLPESWNTGEKEICVQVEDAARARSNIACDLIIFDPIAPEGAISTEAEVVTQTNIELNTEALDPKLDDGNDGIGNIQMRFSETGRNCQLITQSFDFPQGDTSEFEDCESTWLDWEDFSPTKDWQLNETGLNYIYVQFKDGIDNLSDIYSTTVIYNPFAGEGDILINNDEIFTNEELVNLDLSLNCMSLLEGVESFCGQSPVLMRLVTTHDDSTAELPPIWNTREEYETYINSVMVSGVEPWTYWTEYQSNMQWHLLGGNNTIFDESNDPESPYSEDFGKKNVYVQYLFADGSVSELQKDSIVYAPFYGVEYSAVEESSLGGGAEGGEGIYTINNIPVNLYSQDQITVKLNAKNIGSFTWAPYTVVTGESEVQPVKVSYMWKQTSPQPSPIGEGAIPNEYRGNSAILPENISWNEETGELELIVDTPLFPGEYELVIDTIHEGVTWFSDFGNDVLSYEIYIDQNPDKDPQPLGSSIPDEDDAIGAGGGCYAGGTNSFRGILKTAPAGWPGPYYIDVDGNGASNSDGFFYGYTQFLGQEVIADVVYRNSNCVFASINMYAAPKTWRSTWDSNVGSNSIYNNTIHIQRGESINFNLVFRNDGTGVWERNNVFMYASSTGSQTLTTNFDRSNFGIEMYTGYSSVGQSGGGLFQAHIEIPSDKPVGLYSLCYKLSDNKGYSWEKNDTKCISVQVELNSADEQELRCAEPHNVYKLADVNSTVIAVLNQNDSVVVVEDLVIEGTHWMRVAHPTNPTSDAWVDNSDDCFDFITTIDNPIQAPDIPEPKTPSGDTGVIIAIDGLDVRHGPSPLFPIKDTIPYDSEVRVIGQITLPFGYGHWLKIEYVDDNGVTQEGWVSDGFVAHVNNPPVIQFNITPPFIQSHTCSAVDARSLPGNQFSVVKSLSGNFNTNIIAKWDASQLGGSGVWYQIYLDSTGQSVGWVPEGAMCRGYWSPPPAAGGKVEGISSNNGGGFYNGVLYQMPVRWPYFITGVLNDSRPVGNGYHDGTDYATNCGMMITNAADGKIKDVVSGYGDGWYEPRPSSADPVVLKAYYAKVAYFKGRANFIVIEHYNGTITKYVHMKDVWFTKADIGKHVNGGQGLGTVGRSGLASGCHLHLTFIDSNGDVRSFQEIMQGSLDDKIQSIQTFLDKKTTSYHLFQDERDNFRQYGNCSATYREVKWAELKDLESTWRSGYAFYSPAVNTTIFVKNSILDEYLGTSGPCGVLGYPKYSSGWIKGKKYINHYSEVEALPSQQWGTTGWYQQFENGQIYFNERTNDSYHVYGEIYKVYSQLEGTWGSYGFPKSDPYQQSGQLCQNFEGGKICESDVADLLIYDKVNKLGGGSKDGVVHDWCGTRVLDFHNIAGHGDSIIMVNPNDGKAYLITGAIWDTYWKNGGCNKFGFPTMDEVTTEFKYVNDGGKSKSSNVAFQGFSKKLAIFSSGYGTFYSTKDYLYQYNKKKDVLGFPISNEDSATSQCGTTGSYQRFVGGTIYVSYYGWQTLTHSNSTRDHYLRYRSQGELWGKFGWPRTDYTSDNKMYFERGEMHKRTGLDAIFNGKWDENVTGCRVIDVHEEDDNNDNDVPQNVLNAIHQKELKDFNSFSRSSDIHKFSCGSEEYYKVEYSAVQIPTGSYGKTVIVTNGHWAHLITGEILKKWNCNVHGHPTMDTVLNDPLDRSDRLGKTFVYADWQNFSKSIITRNKDIGTLDITIPGIVNVFKSADIDGDYPNPNGFLGIPIESIGNKDRSIVIGGETINYPYSNPTIPEITNQKFLGGYILWDEEGQRYVKVLDEFGLQSLENYVKGDSSSNIFTFIKSFAEGFINTIKDTLNNIGSLLEIGLEIATAIFGGGIGIVLKVAEVIYNLVQLVVGLLPNIGNILAAIKESGQDVIASIAGSIAAGAFLSFGAGIGVGGIFGKAKNVLVKLGDVGKTIKKLGSIAESIDGKIYAGLQAIAKRGSDVSSRILDKINDFLHRSPDKASLLKGDISKLDELELDDAIRYIETKNNNLDIEDYLEYKNTKVSATIDSFAVQRELDALRAGGKYDLLDTNHTILGDFNIDGTFKGGGHSYDVMDSYIRNSKVKAYLDEGRTQPITSLAGAPRNSAGVVRAYVDEYKGVGNLLDKPTLKTFSPEGMTTETYLDIGNTVITDGVSIGGNRFEVSTIYGNVISVIPDNAVQQRTWYFTF